MIDNIRLTGTDFRIEVSSHDCDRLRFLGFDWIVKLEIDVTSKKASKFLFPTNKNSTIFMNSNSVDLEVSTNYRK